MRLRQKKTVGWACLGEQPAARWDHRSPSDAKESLRAWRSSTREPRSPALKGPFRAPRSLLLAANVDVVVGLGARDQLLADRRQETLEGAAVDAQEASGGGALDRRLAGPGGALHERQLAKVLGLGVLLDDLAADVRRAVAALDEEEDVALLALRDDRVARVHRLVDQGVAEAAAVAGGEVREHVNLLEQGVVAVLAARDGAADEDVEGTARQGVAEALGRGLDRRRAGLRVQEREVAEAVADLAVLEDLGPRGLLVRTVLVDVELALLEHEQAVVVEEHVRALGDDRVAGLELDDPERVDDLLQLALDQRLEDEALAHGGADAHLLLVRLGVALELLLLVLELGVGLGRHGGPRALEEFHLRNLVEVVVVIFLLLLFLLVTPVVLDNLRARLDRHAGLLLLLLGRLLLLGGLGRLLLLGGLRRRRRRRRLRLRGRLRLLVLGCLGRLGGRTAPH